VSSIASIGDTAAWMAHASGDKPVGVMGLSFSGSLSLLAAAEPRYKRDIKFVVAVGSEDAMSRVANYYLTGRALRPSGDAEMLAPHEYGALVLEYESLEDFVPKPDREAVRLVLRDHLYEDLAGGAGGAREADAGQRAEARQLMDTTSPKTRKMIAESDARHLAAMASVSPDGQLTASGDAGVSAAWRGRQYYSVGRDAVAGEGCSEGRYGGGADFAGDFAFGCGCEGAGVSRPVGAGAFFREDSARGGGSMSAGRSLNRWAA
jgi:hypothetical protein